MAENRRFPIDPLERLERFLVAIIILGIVLFYSSISLRAHQISTWPQVQGVISNLDVGPYQPNWRIPETWKPPCRVSYSYRVGEEAFTGFADLGLDSDEQAKYPVAGSISLSYDPDRTSRSVLRDTPVLTPSPVIITLVMLLCCALILTYRRFRITWVAGGTGVDDYRDGLSLDERRRRTGQGTVDSGVSGATSVTTEAKGGESELLSLPESAGQDGSGGKLQINSRKEPEALD